MTAPPSSFQQAGAGGDMSSMGSMLRAPPSSVRRAMFGSTVVCAADDQQQQQLDYSAYHCREGHGGSHCSPQDIMEGTNAMNTLDDDSGYSTLAQLMNGPGTRYDAAVENLTGNGCPDPSAHVDFEQQQQQQQ